MFDTIGATVQKTDINTQRLKERFWHLVGRMMQHVFIKMHVSFHRIWAQVMGHHDVFDIVTGAVEPIAQSLQTIFGVSIGDGGDPGLGSPMVRVGKAS